MCDRIGDAYGFAVVNLANPDMVGHTGSIPAVVAAVEATDDTGSRRPMCPRFGGVCLVTADHGNAEVMLEPDGTSPHTAHLESGAARRHGRGNRAPGQGRAGRLARTVLGMLGLEIPGDADGQAAHNASVTPSDRS